MKNYLLAIVIAIGAVSSTAYSKDVLQLANGVSLPGKLVSIEDGWIRFEADILGEVTVAVSEASVVEGPDQAGEQQAGEVTVVTEPDAVPVGELVASDAGATEAADVAGVIEPQPEWWQFWEWNLLSDKWSGDFTFGLTDVSSNVNSQEVKLAGAITYQASDIDQLQWEGYYQFKDQDNQANVDKYGTSLRYRRDVSEQIFLQSLNKYDIDRIKKIDHNVQNSVGVGWRAIDTERVKLNLVPGVGSQYIWQAGPSGWFFKMNAYQDFQWVIWDDLTFEQRFDYWIQPNNTNNYNYTLRAAITKTLIGNFILRLSFQKDFDNNVVLGTTKDERTIAASIGFKF